LTAAVPVCHLNRKAVEMAFESPSLRHSDFCEIAPPAAVFIFCSVKKFSFSRSFAPAFRVKMVNIFEFPFLMV
jgi:hypothetical protein